MSEMSKRLSVWLVRLHKHPVKALEDCKESYARSAGAHTKKLYESIGFMTAFVRHLNSDERSMKEFREHRFWASNTRATSSKHLSIMAVRFLLGAGEAKGALYEQARSYAKLVEFFLSEKTEPSAIPDVLSGKTIYGLLDQLAKGGVKKVVWSQLAVTRMRATARYRRMRAIPAKLTMPARVISSRKMMESRTVPMKLTTAQSRRSLPSVHVGCPSGVLLLIVQKIFRSKEKCRSSLQ